MLVRLGLTDLEAGYAVSQLHGHVGDRMRVTYTLRNGSRFPKPWLEIHNPTTMPGGLPGRAITLRGRTERSWLIRAPLSRRGHFRIEPLHIRTGDPFGFFEASATVGQGISVVVYPRLEPLPGWRLPAAQLEGSHASPVRTLQTTPLATTVRPYAPGDAMNRIHWKTTARHGEIQVKEFDLEQTADAWIVLDLQRSVQAGRGDESTVEASIRAAASIADKALQENRAVGMTVNVGRTAFLPPDRGGRQHLKIMQLLAAVEADGSAPLVETLISTVGRLRRGMTAVIITPSLDPSWVRPLASLRGRGVACVVVTLDAAAYERFTKEAHAAATGDDRETRRRSRRARRQARPRPAPCAGRVRAEIVRHHAGPAARRDPGPMKRRITLAPEEGWLTLGLVLLLCLTLAWSVDGARWVLGRDEYLDFLVWAAAGGVLVGFIGPKVGWGRWLTFLIGSIFAALLVPLMTGLVVHPTGASLARPVPVDLRRERPGLHRHRRPAPARRRPSTSTTSLIIGMLVWATSMFASYAVFGHRRPLNAVVVVGVLLVANMSLTFARPAAAILVVFSLAALLLLIRAHVFDEQSEWLRRRIGDPASISSVYLRGGAVFIAIAVAAALALTADGVVRAAGGRVGRRRGRARRPVEGGLALPADRRHDPLARHRASGRRPWCGPSGTTTTRWRSRSSATRRTRPTTTGAPSPTTRSGSTTGASGRRRRASRCRPTRRSSRASPTIRSSRATSRSRSRSRPTGSTTPTMISPATPDHGQPGRPACRTSARTATSRCSSATAGTGRTSSRRPRRSTGNEPGRAQRRGAPGDRSRLPAGDPRPLHRRSRTARSGRTPRRSRTRSRRSPGTTRSTSPRRSQKELQSSTYKYSTDVCDVDCGNRSTTECFATFKQGFCQ